MVRTNKNTLLAYYECRQSYSDWAEIDIKVIRSTDGGETWKTVKIIPGNGNTLNNPVMVVYGDEIFFLYCKNYKQLFILKSLDDGINFSDEIEISSVYEKGGFDYTVAAIGPGYGIVHNGTILIPAWFAYNKDNPKAHYPSFISVIYSKDNGATWNIGDVIGKDVLKEPSESALAVTNNKVLISVRNEEKKRALFYSENGYSNWSEKHLAESLTDPCCQGSIDYRDGMFFHINCSHEEVRKNLCIKFSDDGFDTYKEIFIDEEGGYSDIAVSDDTIYVLYESDVDNDGMYFKAIKNYKFYMED